ncbi:MAG TPA: c-type cytochrome, partial [Saprospiraceae bacterium]|nr:c-type cytochrome [Saprospiraceae bacterium]
MFVEIIDNQIIKNIGMLSRFIKLPILVIAVVLMCVSNVYAQPSPDAGKGLFTSYCAACHAKDMKSALTGPALGGAEANWDTKENLYAWIRNSQAVIKAGHPRAVELWNKYKPTVMTAFPNLTDDEIASMLLYIDGVYNGTYPPKAAGAPDTSGASVSENKGSSNWTYGLIILFLAFLSFILFRILGNLNQLSAAKEGIEYEKPSLLSVLTSKGLVTFLLFCLVIFGGYTTVNRAINLGRQQGYEPDQPIKFSHVTHAGINKIDCQYCHDGARRSKHSVIPAANTCMNCHSAIKVGSQYGTAEITKIYASIGFDPLNNKYVENYEKMSEEEIKKLYTAWMADAYVTDKGLAAIDSEGEDLVEKQWRELKKSLTNEQKKTIPGPIEWVRIHNLPDHAYFNHAQHVAIGKVACQTCHGEVEKMEVVKQYSPLSMGWCINCHRETEVKFSDNDYYNSYEKFHTEIKDGKRTKVTVADIGGLECQKCH